VTQMTPKTLAIALALALLLWFGIGAVLIFYI
jgi:hypothetical protein